MGEAVVEFDYTAQEEDELTLKAGDLITNVVKVSEGWCEGCVNGRKGMFPDNFVKEVKKDVKAAALVSAMPAKRQNAGNVSEIRNKLRSVIIPGGAPPMVAKKPVKKAKVTFAYVPQQEDELGLEVGNIVDILKQDEPNWWEGSLNGKVGMFPSNFVEVIGQTESADKPASDEAPAIRGRKVEGVGFGNIFGGGPIVLRSKLEKRDSVDPSKFPNDPKQPPVKLKPAVPGPAPTAAAQARNNTKPVVKARVMYPYAAANDDELDLTEGDVVVILDQNLEDDGWWKGEVNGKTGVFPDNFVELLPVESEKPPKPAMPPPPTVNNVGLKSTANSRPLAAASEPSKPSESKPNLETDDYKAKKNKECFRTGTLDSVKTSYENALSHPTAFRVKPPVRRPPAAGPGPLREAPTPDEKLASVAKVQPQVPVKDDSVVILPAYAPKVNKDVTHDTSSQGGYATREQHAELQREMSHLREAVEQTRKYQEKRFHELMAEIDEEKKIRLNLQVEVERLKKMVKSD